MAPRLPDINWDDLKFFLAIARGGSLHQAARNLNASRTTIKRKLDLLEHSFDAKLFNRMHVGLNLTDIGIELLPYAEKIEAEVAGASRQLASRDQNLEGQVRLAMPHFLSQSRIMDHLTEFVALYPDIDLDIALSRQIASLGRRETDISIRFAYEVTDDVVGRRLVNCTRAAYCSRNYAAKIKDNGGCGLFWIGGTDPDRSNDASWISETDYCHATQHHYMREASVLIAFAKAGEGLAMLPCFIGDGEAGLVRAPYQTTMPDRSLWLLLHRDMQKTPKIRLLTDHLAKCITSTKTVYEVN